MDNQAVRVSSRTPKKKSFDDYVVAEDNDQLMVEVKSEIKDANSVTKNGNIEILFPKSNELHFQNDTEFKNHKEAEIHKEIRPTPEKSTVSPMETESLNTSGQDNKILLENEPYKNSESLFNGSESQENIVAGDNCIEKKSYVANGQFSTNEKPVTTEDVIKPKLEFQNGKEKKVPPLVIKTDFIEPPEKVRKSSSILPNIKNSKAATNKIKDEKIEIEVDTKPKRRRRSRAAKVEKVKEAPKLRNPSDASISGISLHASTKIKPKGAQPMTHTCKKTGCGKTMLKCTIKASDACAEAIGYTSRWYHLSLEEHYCNACFDQFYRSKYEGFEEFHEWKKAWAANSKTDSSFKNISNFLAEKHLPYWIKCTKCNHWRQLGNDVDLTSDVNRKYTCSMGNMVNTLGIDSNDTSQRMPHVKFYCSQPSEDCVNLSIDPSIKWMSSLNYTPFLKYSPAAPFLTSYYPDGVGMSATDISSTPVVLPPTEEHVCVTERVLEIRKKQKTMDTNVKPNKSTENVKKSEMKELRLIMSPGSRKTVKQSQNQVEGVGNYFQPFYKPFERGKALCMRPDVMELDEAKQFPQYVKDQGIYLAVRNLIVALWTLNQKSFLTVEKCCDYVITRGLTRINLCENLVPNILQFATYKGLVNSGVLHNPPRPLLSADYTKKDVIVVGAGPAGLGAARQLHNFGISVKILEARDRIGGRAYDDFSLDDVCVGHGAQIINGCVNNPMSLMAHQLDLKLQILKPQCDLYDSSGTWVPMHCDKRMDFHFNALLDIIAEWRRAQQNNSDCSLGIKIEEAHKEWMKQSGLKFTEMEEQLLNFHIGNLEFACGASLDKVSAFFWDQNETFAQFNGDHTLVQFGFSTLLESLSTGLDIRFNSPVKNVDYSSEGKIKVTTDKGEEHTADFVLITLPIGVLKSNLLTFTPPLPTNKSEALSRIGSGCIEKIGMLFPHRFWEEKINNANYFGYIPPEKEQKGFFTVFYDVPKVNLENGNVLMSVISGDCVDKASKMTEKEVIDIAMSILRSMFPNKNVPEPTKYFVTRWKVDPYASMAYSYIHTGSSGEDYDILAKSINNKVYFAGEGTNRHFPQTVTGAYLSGLREAAKIAVANVE